MIGSTISHYKILEKLGEGGMGVVYKAQDLKLDRLVALKFLPPHLADQKDKQRFINEAKAASALDHPNICTIHEIGETPEGQIYIAMACYRGETIQQKIVKRQLSIDDCINYTIQIAEGLQAAHKKGIVHRDIKSSNIMITDAGQVKIMDFGLAKTAATTMTTKTGATVGTVPYMSPEQARGEKVDHRTDIWSLGVVMYEMVTGRPPFQSAYSEAVVYSILNENPPPLGSLRKDLPKRIETIVSKCLEKEAGRRFQIGDELVAELGELGSFIASHRAQSPRTTFFSGKYRPWSVAGSTALLIVILLMFFFPLRITREAKVDSIAVLPLENFSNDAEQEYFSDGITEALITDLAKISSLRVISRTSVMRYKGAKKSIPEIARELNVDALVEGSVQRVGDRIRVTAQLIQAESDKHLWADSYERNVTDILALQAEIALAIANEIHAKITSQEEIRFAAARPVNKDAYDLYLRGRYYLKKQSVREINRAIEFLEQTVQIDPHFATALASLGMAYSQKSFYDEPLKKEWEEKAFVAIEKALAIDPNMAEAYVAKGTLLWTPANRFPHEEAIATFRHAVELNPNLDEGHEWLGLVYYHVGLMEAGLEECQKALQINPSSAFAQSRVGINLLYSGRYEEALVELRKVPDGFSPQIVPPQIAITLFYLGRMEEAKRVLEEAFKQLPEEPFLLSTQALLLAREGKTTEAMRKIQLAEKKEKTYLGHFHHAAYNIGSSYALMRKNALAVDWLHKAIDGGFPCYPKYEQDPNLNNLRQDPAFTNLMRNLTKQWQKYRGI